MFWSLQCGAVTLHVLVLWILQYGVSLCVLVHLFLQCGAVSLRVLVLWILQSGAVSPIRCV